MKLSKQKIQRFVFLTVQCCVLLGLFSIVSSAQVYDRSSCKKLKNFKKSFEASKKGQDSLFEYKYELINCPEALPILRKYAFESNADVRTVVLDILQAKTPSADILKIFVEYVQRYPAEDRAVYLTTFYPCRFFQSLKSPGFTKVLIERTKTLEDNRQDQALFLLGCLAKGDKKAFNWLETLSNPQTKTSLSPNGRAAQLLNVAYARAELEIQEAVNTVLSDIDQIDARGDFNEITAELSDRIPHISNCLILNRLSNFITDKRGYSETLGTEKINNRLSEKAIEIFTLSLGESATGEKNGEWRRLHTDQELEQIQRRVRSYLNKQCINGLLRR